MSLQKFTKGLRDKDIPILARTQTARDALRGVNQIYIPRKELVLLEWALAALSLESEARSLPQLWSLIADLWPELDRDSQMRLVRSYKIVNTLLDTLKAENLSKEAVSEIENALDNIFKSVVLNIVSDAQAGTLILSYLAHVQGAQRNILPQLQAQVGSRKKIFKPSARTLSILLGAVNTDELLVDYFTVPGVEVEYTSSAPLGRLMSAIVASKTQVTERFAYLAQRQPEKLLDLVENLGTHTLDRKVWTSLLDQQIAQENWKCVQLILQKDPSEAISRLDHLFAAMEKDFDLPLALYMVQATTQMRKIDEFIAHWIKACQNNHSAWTCEPMLDAISASLYQLSSLQLVSLLTSLDIGVSQVLSLVGFKAVASQRLKDTLQALFVQGNAAVCFAVLNLWPSIPQSTETVGKLSPSAHQVACTLILLEQRLLNAKACQKSINNLLKKGKLEGSLAGHLLGRFYPVLDQLEVSPLTGCMSNHDLESLLQHHDIYEYPKIASQVVEEVLAQRGARIDTFLYVPIEALSKKQRVNVLERAWVQANLKIIERMLATPLHATKYEEDPSLLLDLGRKCTENECDLFISIASKLAKNSGWLDKLRAVRSSTDTWADTCMLIYTGPKDAVKLLESSIKKGKNVQACLAVLIAMNEAVDPALLGGIASSPNHSRQVFTLLCRNSIDWMAITALFIFNGCEQVEEYCEFISRLSKLNAERLFKIALLGHQYKVLEAVLDTSVIDKHDLVPLVTLMVQSNYTNPNNLSGTQMQQYFELMARMFRDDSWAVSQYALETVVATVGVLSTEKYITFVERPIELFESMCLVLSRCLLFQRYRLANRNHLIIGALSALFKCLSGANLSIDQHKSINEFPRYMQAPDNPLRTSTSASENLLRVTINFCEPPQRTVREGSGKNNLTSSVAKTRRHIARTIPVLLVNFAFFAVQYGYSPAIQSNIQQAVFSVFNVLSSEELQSTLALMDNSTRVYMKTIYENYKSIGKWTRD